MSKSVVHTFNLPVRNVQRFELTFLQDVVPHRLELDSEIKINKRFLNYCKLYYIIFIISDMIASDPPYNVKRFAHYVTIPYLT